LADDDSRSGQYDVAERIRQLNEEMAKESPLPDAGPSQMSVKFKDDPVDFVSSTPEPVLDSEEDAELSSQNTPRSDAEESPREPCSFDPDPTEDRVLNEISKSGQSQSLETNRDSNSPSNSPSNPAEPKLNYTEARNGISSEFSMLSNVNSSQENAVLPSAASDEEATYTDEEIVDKASSSSDSTDTHSPNATQVSKVFSATTVLSTATGRPKSAAAKPVGGMENGDLNKPIEHSNSESVKADSETADEECISPVGREKSSSVVTETSSAVLAAKVMGKANAIPNSEADDMALVECSGKFRMMSVAELTALQRRCASACSRSPDTVRTPRPPYSPSTCSPRLSMLFDFV